jgi:hypothetical protein
VFEPAVGDAEDGVAEAHEVDVALAVGLEDGSTLVTGNPSTSARSFGSSPRV